MCAFLYPGLSFLVFQGEEGDIRKVPSSYLLLAFVFLSRKRRKEKGKPVLVPLSPPFIFLKRDD